MSAKALASYARWILLRATAWGVISAASSRVAGWAFRRELEALECAEIVSARASEASRSSGP